MPGGGAIATMFRERSDGSSRVMDAPSRAPASSMDVGGGYRMSSSVGSVCDAALVLLLAVEALLAPLPPLMLPSVAEGVDGGGGGGGILI